MKSITGLVCEVAAITALFCLAFLSAPRVQGQTTVFSYPPFAISGATGLQTNSYNNNAGIVNGVLQITSSGGDQVGSAWYTNPTANGTAAPLSLATGFTTVFEFQIGGLGGIVNPSNNTTGADGFAYVVQNGTFGNYYNDTSGGATALGPNDTFGGEIGITGLTNSVAVQFDIWCNTNYHDTCATNSPTSADQITVESCGPKANTVNHQMGCSFGTVDLSMLATPIYIGDGNMHTATISYGPPTSTSGGSCPPGSAAGTAGCGSLTVMIDSQTVLTVPFNLAYLGLDANDDAYVGFTGATGGAYATQDIDTWTLTTGFASAVSQAVTIPTTPGTNVNVPGNFSNTVGSTLNTDIFFVLPNTTLTPAVINNNTISNPVFITTSMPLFPTDPGSATNIYPEFVVGTPWATSQCTLKAVYGSNNYCALYTIGCYQNGTSSTNASDAACPTVAVPDSDDYILLTDTFDWEGGKWMPTPGFTASLIAFTVPTTDPSLLWGASTTSTNPVCPTQVNNTPPLPACYLSDTLINMYGDQTTTKGSKPKGKSWTISAVQVPMLATDITLTPPSPNPLMLACSPMLNNPPTDSSNFAANLWNNGACILDFVVDPAQAPLAPNNNFQAAEPAFLEYGYVQGIPTPVAPPVLPGPLPTGDVSLPNPSPSLTCNIVGCSATNWDTGLNQSLTTFFHADGTYTLHWSAKDAAGIIEKNIQLDTNPGGICVNPGYSASDPTSGQPSYNAPCYTTNYFTTQVNIDSVAPALTPAGCTQMPASPTGNGWYNTDVAEYCTAADDRSGIASGGPNPITPSSTTGTAPVTFSLSTGPTASFAVAALTPAETLKDYAGNTFVEGPLGPFSIDVVAPTISVGFTTGGKSFPNGSTFSMGQAVSVVYTCGDVGSGLGICAGTAYVCPGAGMIGSTAASPAPVGISTTALGPQSLAPVSAADCAGNPSAAVIPTYNVTAPAANVGLYLPTSSSSAQSVTYGVLALDTNANTAYNVLISFAITAPSGVVGGQITGTWGNDSNCNLSGCPASSFGNACSTAPANTVGATSATVTCNLGTLASLTKTLKGAGARISIPIASGAPAGGKITVKATVSSANSSSNSTPISSITVK
jgi:Bacterial lectin